jgi:micrococcal nuclease
MFEYFCKLERVVDGDTIDVNIDLGFDIHHSARVRMMGIDTPETRTRNKAEKALGLASKARLKEMLKGQVIKLATSKEGKGKFGRVLADVITIDADGKEFNCNAELIAEGHARPYFGGTKVPWF